MDFLKYHEKLKKKKSGNIEKTNFLWKGKKLKSTKKLLNCWTMK